MGSRLRLWSRGNRRIWLPRSCICSATNVCGTRWERRGGNVQPACSPGTKYHNRCSKFTEKSCSIVSKQNRQIPLRIDPGGRRVVCFASTSDCPLLMVRSEALSNHHGALTRAFHAFRVYS